MSKQNDENVKTGQQGTNKPWERPGQSSQDPGLEPPGKKDKPNEKNKETRG